MKSEQLLARQHSEQYQNKHKRFFVADRDALRSERDRAHQIALCCVEPGAQHEAQAAAVRRSQAW
jgi:hypothetical protein